MTKDLKNVLAYLDHARDILERVNKDPDLIREVNRRQDLEYPDLKVALVSLQAALGQLRSPQ